MKKLDDKNDFNNVERVSEIQFLESASPTFSEYVRLDVIFMVVILDVPSSV